MATGSTRDAGVWVDHAASAAAGLRQSAGAATTQAWTAFDSWYDAAAVAVTAREISGLSETGQRTTSQLLAEYLAQVTAALLGSTTRTPRIPTRKVRNGVDLVLVHSRPAEVFKETYALTGDEEKARKQAVDRGLRLIQDDLMLAGRAGQRDTLAELGISRYRRVLRPDRSETGPCGLCVVGADQKYRIAQLMPMHSGDCCLTLPIVGDADPGIELNREDLDEIYAVAGSTAAEDLKRTRVSIGEHGELGPVLRVRGQKFTGPEDLAQPVDNELGRKRLAKLQTVLQQLQQTDRAGEDVSERLAYQQGAIARTTAQIA